MKRCIPLHALRAPVVVLVTFLAPVTAAQQQQSSSLSPESSWDPIWERCRDEEACRTQGRCARNGDHCFALNQAMCLASDNCRENGACVHNAEKGVCDDGLQRRNRGALAGGVVLVALGGASLLAGTIVWWNMGFTDSAAPVFVPVLVGGAAAAAGGIALSVYGGAKVPREPSAALELGPGAITLRYRF